MSISIETIIISHLSFFWKEIVIKLLIETSIVVLTFAAWFSIEIAASSFKGEKRP